MNVQRHNPAYRFACIESEHMGTVPYEKGTVPFS